MVHLKASKGEDILYRFIRTSYPHGTIGLLAQAIAERLQINDVQVKHKLDIDLEELDKGMQPWDFIRCIELKRNDRRFAIVLKRYVTTQPITEIRDCLNTHEAFITIEFQCDGAQVLIEPEAIADIVVDMYTHVTGSTSKTGEAWVCRNHPRIDGCDDLACDRKALREIIVNSISKTWFHVLLNTTTVLLLDQKHRIEVAH